MYHTDLTIHARLLLPHAEAIQKHRQSEQQLLETRAHVLDLEGREIALNQTVQ